MECGTGTYIRSIVRDLGEALGCGAHVTVLRRLWVAPFTAPAMHSLESLVRTREEQGEAALDALLLPTADGLAGWPTVVLDSEQSRRLAQGQVIAIAPKGSAATVRVDDASGRVLGIADLGEDGQMRARRLFRWAV